MSISSFFGFGFRALTLPGDHILPELFTLSMRGDLFVETDISSIYTKILTDCIDRVQGIPEEVEPLLWDNCLQNQSTHGLITWLAYSMTWKTQLFLVYNPALGVLRKATSLEEQKIEADYKSKGDSDIGVFVSFERYRKTDMIRLYSFMEYCTVASLNKMVNLSKSIQFKMGDMRSSVGLNDASVAIEQAKTMATALRDGRDVLMDKNDEIFTSSPDISSIKESIAFLDSKRSFYYGMPLSYINGEQTPGIGSTGEADTKAVERGLRQYYISVLKPVLEALFDIDVNFKSNDFRQIGSALEAIKTFELVSDELITRENKQLIIARLFDLDTDTTTNDQVSS